MLVQLTNIWGLFTFVLRSCSFCLRVVKCTAYWCSVKSWISQDCSYSSRDLASISTLELQQWKLGKLESIGSYCSPKAILPWYQTHKNSTKKLLLSSAYFVNEKLFRQYICKNFDITLWIHQGFRWLMNLSRHLHQSFMKFFYQEFDVQWKNEESSKSSKPPRVFEIFLKFLSISGFGYLTGG